jgi:hypothetical protein
VSPQSLIALFHHVNGGFALFFRRTLGVMLYCCMIDGELFAQARVFEGSIRNELNPSHMRITGLTPYTYTASPTVNTVPSTFVTYYHVRYAHSPLSCKHRNAQLRARSRHMSPSRPYLSHPRVKTIRANNVNSAPPVVSPRLPSFTDQPFLVWSDCLLYNTRRQ